MAVGRKPPRFHVLVAGLLSAGALAAAPQAGYALGVAPVALTPPAISVSAEQGRVVTCSRGTWLTGPTSYAYSGQRDASSIAGASASQYTLTAFDVGHVITCTVVAHNPAGDSLPAISLPITPLPMT